MKSRPVRRVAVAALSALGLAAACTNDFDQFEARDQESAGGSSAVSGGASQGAAGAVTTGGRPGTGGRSAGGALPDGAPGDADAQDASPDGAPGAGGSPADSGAGGSLVDSGAGGSPVADAGAGGAGAGGSPVDSGAGGSPVADAGAGGAGAGGSPVADAGAGGAGAGGAGAGGQPACSSAEKECGAACVLLTAPQTGCAAADCDPCALPNATSVCVGGACSPDQCSPGFGNCDTASPVDGCERSIVDDVSNCGGCDRACSGNNVGSLACTGSACTSSCDFGFANCQRPTSGPDDGCETDVSSSNTSCGGCGNSCANQRLDCMNSRCGCTTSGQCRNSGPPGPSCEVATGLCRCNATTLCAPGETCSGPNCRCNGGAPCTSGQTCCETPAGCRDLATDPASCGACGFACPPGFACSGGSCVCDGDVDCDGGAGGVCTGGSCECGGTPCGPLERCTAQGTCG